MINPLLEEQIKAGFLNPAMMRLHLIGLGAISFMVFLFYPSQPISYFLARSVRPEMFNIALYTIIAFVSYLTVNTAVFSIQGIKIIGLKEWFVYAKMPAGTYFRGRVIYGFFYTLFLILLFTPVLVVAASVSAISPESLASILLIILLFAQNIYFLGLFFFMIFKKQHWLLALILWFSILILLFISPAILKINQPILIFIEIQKTDNIISFILQPIIISVSISIVMIVLSRISLYFYSRRLHD